MNKTSQEKLQAAMQYAMSNRPTVGGFPYLAECLRLAGVRYNLWSLPSLQSIYVMGSGSIVQQGAPLVSGMHEVPTFDKEALVTALRKDQNGQSTFMEFLTSIWGAGVIKYEVNFLERHVSYYGINDECYKESYPSVEIKGLDF